MPTNDCLLFNTYITVIHRITCKYIPGKYDCKFNKIASETNEDFQISALNLMNIKNRLIWVVYYKSYTGPESIQALKSKNDYLIGKIAMSNVEN